MHIITCCSSPTWESSSWEFLLLLLVSAFLPVYQLLECFISRIKQNPSYFLIQQAFFSPRKYCHVNLPMGKIVIHLVHGSWKILTCTIPNCNDTLIYAASIGRAIGFHNSRITRNMTDMINILLKCWIKNEMCVCVEFVWTWSHCTMSFK